MRLGMLIFVGVALLAAAALGLEWRYAPAALRLPLVEVVLSVVGGVLLVAALVALVLDRPAPATLPDAPSPPEDSRAEPSLLSLPALAVGETELSDPARSPEPSKGMPLPPTFATAAPTGVTATDPGHSTLLIPFAEEPSSGVPAPEAPVPGETVSRLMDRMDAIQRVTPTNPSAPALSYAPPTGATPRPSELLLRLTHIPAPPTDASTASAPRRCSDCGDPLGSPPQCEPCAECGQALCERCYWRTSSGPQAHLCARCFQDRSVPRPPAPAVTFAPRRSVASVSTPTERSLRPRRPGS